MNAALQTRAVETLEDRLERGANLLFDLEQRGDTGAEYSLSLRTWIELLQQYERAQAA